MHSLIPRLFFLKGQIKAFLICTLIACCTVLLPLSMQGQTHTVSFTDLGNFTTPDPITADGITVMGSGSLRLTTGIAGGVSVSTSLLDSLIFGENEFALFSFDGGRATEVAFDAGAFAGFDPLCSVEGFDPAGVSLGRVAISFLELISPYNVSATFDNRVLSAFRIRGGLAGGLRVGWVRYTVDATTNAMVSGRITLQGAVNQAQATTFEFRPTDGSATQTRTITLAADGSFQFTLLPRKVYSVRIKAASWLAEAVTIDVTAGDVTTLSTTLLAGDATNDNTADISDLLLLIAHFNQSLPSADYLEAADLNIDGTNDTGDLVLLIGNYNLSGK